jgi:hypothetical protein
MTNFEDRIGTYLTFVGAWIAPWTSVAPGSEFLFERWLDSSITLWWEAAFTLARVHSEPVAIVRFFVFGSSGGVEVSRALITLGVFRLARAVHRSH